MALAFDSQHALLATLSWDNCLRVFDTSTPTAAAAPAVAVNEHGGPFTALHYDRVNQQVPVADVLWPEPAQIFGMCWCSLMHVVPQQFKCQPNTGFTPPASRGCGWAPEWFRQMIATPRPWTACVCVGCVQL